MSDERDRARERLHDILGDYAHAREIAFVDGQAIKSGPFTDEILALKGIAVLADDQSLPENPDIPPEYNDLACGAEDDTDNIARSCYLLAQQDMLAAGWRRVVCLR